MLQHIKDELLNDVDKLIELLSHFGYCNFSVKPKYITFGRNEEGSKKSIVIQRLENEALIVHDYPKNIVCDVFNYVIREKGESFKNVIQAAKNIVGIDEYYRPEEKYRVFGGFYHTIKNRCKQEIKTYDDSILDKYKPIGNLRFLRDGISLEAQQFFNIGYDVESQSITIPIYSEDGSLVGVKCRRNCDECEQKYWFDVPCQMSNSLYGYSQNYQFLESSDIVYIAEAEKTVMAAYSFGVRNIVALGSGSISRKQVQLLLSLNPEKIIFLHDADYPIESIMRNIEMVKGYSRMKQVKLGYWNYFGKGYESKVSPTDLGREKFKDILENEIEFVEGAD